MDGYGVLGMEGLWRYIGVAGFGVNGPVEGGYLGECTSLRGVSTKPLMHFGLLLRNLI